MDNLMAVVGAMDMVAGDVAATADETGEKVGMTRPDRRNYETEGCKFSYNVCMMCCQLWGTRSRM